MSGSPVPPPSSKPSVSAPADLPISGFYLPIWGDLFGARADSPQRHRGKEIDFKKGVNSYISIKGIPEQSMKSEKLEIKSVATNIVTGFLGLAFDSNKVILL